MHKSNKTKTGIEENLINIRDNVVRTIALHLKGFEAAEIAKKLGINIEEVNVIIKIFEEEN